MADTIFRLDPEIIIGRDAVNRSGALFGGRGGNKVLLATEQGLYENNKIERVTKILEVSGLSTILFDDIPAQTTADTAETAASLARGARCDMVIGFGGLKTQYIARLASILAASTMSLFDLLDGAREEKAFLPYAAIPTVGGDPFLFSDHLIAVDPRDRFSKLIKCPRGLLVSVILDPLMFDSLSGKLASTSAFDGLSGALEAYCSTRSGFFSDAILEQALTYYFEMIHGYTENQTLDFSTISVNAGYLMSLGAAVSSQGIGAALSYSLNGKFPVAKTWCSTVLLPYIMEKLVSSRPQKMAKAAALMGEPVEGASTAEAANMAVEAVRRSMGQLSVPARLKDFNLSLDRLVPTAEAARSLEFVAYSPWTVASEDAYDLLKQAF